MVPILVSCISSQRSLPSRVRSPTPAKTEKPPCWLAMRAMSSVRMTVLPRPAPPNSPALPPRTSGVSKSMTLMPVSNSSVLRRKFGERRRLAMNRAEYSLALTGPASIDRIAEQIEDPAQRFQADGHVHRLAGIDDVHAAIEPLGGPERDGAHAIAAEVLLHFAGDLELDALVFLLDLEGVIDFGKMPLLELGVKRRADDLHDLAGFLAVGYGGNHWKAPNS